MSFILDPYKFAVAAVYSNFSEQTRRNGPSPDHFDEFGGKSIDFSSDGNTLAVGAHFDDTAGGGNAGSCYILTRSGASWSDQQTLASSTAAASERFGFAVALSEDGNTCAVGLPYRGGGTAEEGGVDIFTRSGGTWSHQQRVYASDASWFYSFGWALALSADGNTMVVGAPQAGSNDGKFYFFTRSGGTWSQQSGPHTFGTGTLGNTGASVALSDDGNTAAIGRPAGGGSATNRVAIWTRSGSTWSSEQEVTPSSGNTTCDFGRSVALSGDGNTLVVGAPFSDVGASNAGAAYVFTRSGVTWTEQDELLASDAGADNYFGHDVDISDNGFTIVVGCSGLGSNQDVYTFFGTNLTTWTEQQKLVASDASGGDDFGDVVAISDDGATIGVGAPNDSNSGFTGNGSVYIFVP